MSLHYSVRPARPDAHLYEVMFVAVGALPAGELLCIARWIPGSYMLRNFAKSIVRLNAVVDGVPVVLQKRDTSSWILPAVVERLEVELDVHAHQASVRAAWLDRQRGFFNGTSLFPYLASRVSEAIALRIEAPTHDYAADWSMATTLDAIDVDARGFGEYRAADWDELVDHPVEMGNLDRAHFTACGVPHEMVFSGGALYDKERLEADLSTICEWHIQFFGEPAPVPRYLFQTALVESGYGGLEHRASTALMATRDSLPAPGSGENRSDAYVTFLGLCSHEYFHTWNIKRIKPQRFQPYKLDRETPTRLLWFFEGVTSYYDDLALVRCGVIDRKRYLTLLAKTLTRVQRCAGRHMQSVTDSSMDAWTKFYLQDENAPNSIVSYYAKGALIALCIDAWLRESTKGRESLDTLMHLLWKRWQDTGDGLAEHEPEQCVAELSSQSVADRLSELLDTTGDLPLESALETLGVNLQWRRRRDPSDTGSASTLVSDSSDDAAENTRPDERERPWLGALLAPAEGGLRLNQVMSDGSAERAGLAPGDVLIAIGGYRVSESTYNDILDRHAAFESIDVHVFRDGRLLEASLPIRAAPADTAQLSVDNAERIDDWLGPLRSSTVETA